MEDEQERVRSIEWCHDSIQGQAILNVKYLESGAIIEGRMSYDDDGHGDDDDDVYCVLNGVIFNDLGWPIFHGHANTVLIREFRNILKLPGSYVISYY